jgi:hypothetical protein
MWRLLHVMAKGSVMQCIGGAYAIMWPHLGGFHGRPSVMAFKHKLVRRAAVVVFVGPSLGVDTTLVTTPLNVVCFSYVCGPVCTAIV